ncbi:hypothetical protein Ddye_000026 [Dipteronia dyeriana]|uniref:Transmembrane protein n=1 Tax=Dipteronia dyeriana TaxID=168575 RepID=A0AAE0CS59_9ROSI|nr:hypothetical protein Ddye_000026 [Dipteronia dyeriana]
MALQCNVLQKPLERKLKLEKVFWLEECRPRKWKYLDMVAERLRESERDFVGQVSERRSKRNRGGQKMMSDWGPVFVAVVLFILLTPGLLIQIPGRNKCIEFGNFQTSGASILVHSIIYFALICIFLLAIGVHMYLG